MGQFKIMQTTHASLLDSYGLYHWTYNGLQLGRQFLMAQKKCPNNDNVNNSD